MPEADVYNRQGDKIGTVNLPEKLFGSEVNQALIREAVLAHLNNQRVGTAKVKTRAEVRGGGRKPWRQKGLRRARHGSIRSPIWKGGGVVFGPQPRDFSTPLPKKKKRQALASALSLKASEGEVLVLDELKMTQPKTKEIYELLKKLGAEKSSLIVTADNQPNVVLSSRNIPGVKVTTAWQVSTYDAVSKQYLVITQDALRKMEEVFA